MDSAGKAKQLLDETGCDGVMVGRGARGNPWIFREIRDYLATGELPPRPSKEEVRDMMLRHTRMEIEFKGEYTGIREMRKHVAWYITGVPGAARLRERVNALSDAEAMRALLMEYAGGA